jgi:ABC-type Fe3+-hydroxamate transport system substrate-binding protein
MRIVSLVPSVTETLSHWDRTPIACTRFCERPDLAHVGGTKHPDVEAIAALEPDLVVVDEEENRREDYEELLARGLDVYVLRVRDLTEVNPMMASLAARVEVQWKPIEVGEPVPERLRAFIPIWRRPWMALGAPTYGSSLLAHLGVANVVTNEGPYPEVDLEAVRERHPDVVLAPSEPYPFGERQRSQLEAVAPMTLVDGKDLFWWGERTRDALGRVAAVVAALATN